MADTAWLIASHSSMAIVPASFSAMICKIIALLPRSYAPAQDEIQGRDYRHQERQKGARHPVPSNAHWAHHSAQQFGHLANVSPCLSACVSTYAQFARQIGRFPLLPVKKAGLKGATHFQKSSSDAVNIAILTDQASKLLWSGIYGQSYIKGRRGLAHRDG